MCIMCVIHMQCANTSQTTKDSAGCSNQLKRNHRARKRSVCKRDTAVPLLMNTWISESVLRLSDLAHTRIRSSQMVSSLGTPPCGPLPYQSLFNRTTYLVLVIALKARIRLLKAFHTRALTKPGSSSSVWRNVRQAPNRPWALNARVLIFMVPQKPGGLGFPQTGTT